MIRFSIPFFMAVFLIHGCATYKPQSKITSTPAPVNKELQHSVYVAGGLGNMEDLEETAVLRNLKEQFRGAGENSTLIFTGNTITGEEGKWDKDKAYLDLQLDLAKDFPGKTIFLPGSNEWQEFSIQKLEDIEDHIKDAELDDVSYLPENGCPLEYIEVNEQLDIILVDSRWFTSNWSRIEGINRKCPNILTRRRFAEELEGYINDGQDKNIIIAMHHPVFSNGKFAGNETFASHLLPVPVLGTIGHVVADLGSFSPERLNSRRYRYLRVLVTALAKESDRIVVVSGHEESLQYLSGGGIHQVISGSLGGKTATRRSKDRLSTIGGSLEYEGLFTYGQKGFARLDYYSDGSSTVNFYGQDGQAFTYPVLPELPNVTYEEPLKPDPNRKAVTSAILTDEDFLERSEFYKFLWGDRYRKYFGTPVEAPVVMLDTLYGGLKITKEGGGHQSYSLRLEDEQGKQYAMRSLRKSALKFLKFKVKGIAYTEDAYEDTWTEDVVSDFFTTAHPFMQLVISPLARAVGVNHSQPELFYVPKQETLGDFNSTYGDELYFIEQRPSDEQKDFRGYRRTLDGKGAIKDFESTTDMLEKLREDESYTIDQRDFIRARIFDMLLGDWDRHQDQWRWAEYEDPDGDKVFQPVPRDRDNAFPKFDGLMMPLIKLFVPATRRWESYGPDISDVKWLNSGGTSLDRSLLTQYDAKVWEEEAKRIQKTLQEGEIDRAFEKLPKAVQDSTSEAIREHLKRRLEKLPEYAVAYSNYLDRIVAVPGTDKDDLFEITRLDDGKTRVVIKRLLSDETNELMFDRTFENSITKELWIYGLGDDDIFKVEGVSSPGIMIRIIGGYGEDKYDISETGKLKVYDWEHEDIQFEDQTPRKQLSDIYQLNTYHWRFFEENTNILVPNIGFRTDDGLFVGLSDTYTNNGFNGDDFRYQHKLRANYYFLFKALELSYSNVYTNIFPKWNFETDAYFTTNRYSQNFFGLGNESENLEDQFGRDYYRSRLQITRVKAGIAYHTLKIKALYEGFEVKEIDDRFFTPENLEEEVFSRQNYLGGELSLYYKNDDAEDFPSKALSFGMSSGYKWNIENADNHFGYFSFYTGFSHSLIPSGNLVLSSKAEVMTNFGENYFFYHAPALGGNNGLRGYRDERFSGKTYFYQTSDLRLRLKSFATPVVPITMGTYLGFDYGRVWLPGEDSQQWHNSYGGGLWISGVNYLTFNAGYFHSAEGNLVQAGFGFQF